MVHSAEGAGGKAEKVGGGRERGRGYKEEGGSRGGRGGGEGGKGERGAGGRRGEKRSWHGMKTKRAAKNGSAREQTCPVRKTLHLCRAKKRGGNSSSGSGMSRTVTATCSWMDDNSKPPRYSQRNGNKEKM